ncbi:MAG: hypothetical protein A3F10_05545 [Coxiella sp. RIFCSPHIGHO2_12_FULL_42_15]|nr:MAG: hypothetical protein A3F10_05545 [Coxiella sp. RIFCSPHIGHO2_12_FULL_42_15]
MSKILEKKEDSLTLDKNYRNFLVDIKERLCKAQVRAALAVNVELVQFYWQVGADLIEKQKAYQWGEGFLTQLSHDMREVFPGIQGFSVTNLKRMRRFALHYPIGPQAVAQLPYIKYIWHDREC